MPAFLAWLIPALVSAASTWHAARQRNQAQGHQDERAQGAWEEQEQRRLMLGRSVMDLLERRPEFRDRIPGPLLEWIQRPARPFTGQSYMPSPLGAGAVGGAAAGVSAWQESTRQEGARGPVPDLTPGFDVSESGNAFSIDAPLLGWTSGQSAMQQAGPDQSSEFQVPDLFGGSEGIGGLSAPTRPPRPEDIPNEEEGTVFSGLPQAKNWPALLEEYFRSGAGP